MSFIERVAPSSGRRVPGIEGLRALAALSVLGFHVWIESSPDDGHPDLGVLDTDVLPNLRSGLTLFFALSGFLLYRGFAAALMCDRPVPDVKAYLANRALRILPAYWVILAITALVLQTAVLHVGGAYDVGAMDDFGELVRNLLLVQSYDEATLHTGINPAWTLVVEVAFYLVLPLLALAAASARATTRRAKTLAALAPVAVLLVTGLVSKLAAHLTGPQTEGLAPTGLAMLEVSFPYNADRFAFGMAAAVLVVALREGWLQPLPALRPAALAGAAALMVLAAAFDAITETRLYDTIVAAACGLLLVYVAAPAPEGRATKTGLRLLEMPIIVAAGIVSYSLYLWQEPVIAWMREHGLTLSGTSGLVANLAILTVVVAALSVVTYRLVEAPAMRHKVRPRKDELPRARAG